MFYKKFAFLQNPDDPFYAQDWNVIKYDLVFSLFNFHPLGHSVNCTEPSKSVNRLLSVMLPDLLGPSANNYGQWLWSTEASINSTDKCGLLFMSWITGNYISRHNIYATGKKKTHQRIVSITKPSAKYTPYGIPPSPNPIENPGGYEWKLWVTNPRSSCATVSTINNWITDDVLRSPNIRIIYLNWQILSNSTMPNHHRCFLRHKFFPEQLTQHDVFCCSPYDSCLSVAVTFARVLSIFVSLIIRKSSLGMVWFSFCVHKHDPKVNQQLR